LLWAWILALILQADGSPARIPPELERAPYYGRSDWLEDSVRTMDLVVLGTPQGPEPADHGPASTSRLDVERILFGDVDRDLYEGGTTIRITAPYRFRWGRQGVYVLLRTSQGYFSMNPSSLPMTLEDWNQLESRVVRSPPDPQRPLYERKTKSQIYHYYSPRMWHQTNVFLMDGEVFVELYDEGKRVLRRSWDRKGRLRRVHRIDEQGNGYGLAYVAGQLSHYAHYRSGKKEGVERDFASDGRLREEIYWNDGLRHGPSREWGEVGAFSEILYEEGFVAPVIRSPGPPAGGFTLHKSELGVTYEGPDRVIRRFEIGMPVSEVSKILRLDLSERTGLHFPFYRIDTFLHVSFENGRVSDIRTGWNGIDYELRRD
jgi:hypothetical protein